MRRLAGHIARHHQSPEPSAEIQKYIQLDRYGGNPDVGMTGGSVYTLKHTSPAHPSTKKRNKENNKPYYFNILKVHV